MEHQKQYSTLIRWLPGADDKSIDVQVAGKADFLSLPLHSVRLRFASIQPLTPELRRKLISILVLPMRGSDIEYWNNVDNLRYGHETKRSIANRGPASKQLPQSITSFYITTFEINIKTDKQGKTVPLRFISGENLSSETRGAVSYCDLEPRSLRDVIQWNLNTAPLAFPLRTVLPPLFVQALNKKSTLVHPCHIGEYIAHITNQAQRNSFDDWHHDITMAVLGSKRHMAISQHVDILLSSKEKPSSIVLPKNSTLYVCLEDAMENFENRRWSLDEYGEPLDVSLNTMLQWACTVSHNSSCSLKDVFERGRLHIATTFIDTCFENMGLVPYQALVHHNKRSALKRSRTAADAEAVQDSGAESSASSSYQGGHVMESRSGLYVASNGAEKEANRSVITLLDFDSHYPSIILEWKLFYAIRSENLSMEKEDAMDVDARSPEDEENRTIDPDYFFSMLNKLVMTKRQTDNKAIVPGIKLVINAMYGSIGASYSTMGDTTLAAAITGHGRELLARAQTAAKRLGATILMGHTDSMLIVHKSQEEAQEICKDINENFTTVKLRVSQTYDLSWVINKTHHISIKGSFSDVGWLNYIKGVFACGVSNVGLCSSEEPASAIDVALRDIEKTLAFPGLVSTAMPPAIRLFHVAVAAILTYGWIHLANVPIEPSLTGDIGARLELPPWFDLFIETIQPLLNRENVKASAWYHYFDRKDAHASAESKNRGKNDGNYRSFLADLWVDKRQRYIPVIRRADKQGFDIPNLQQQTAVDVDCYYWIEKTLRTFQSYVTRTIDMTKSQRDYGKRLLDECLRRLCPRHTSSEATSGGNTEEDLRNSEYYQAAVENYDALLSDHFTPEEIKALPDIATWVDLACNESGNEPSPDLPRPQFDPPLWNRLFGAIKDGLTSDIYHQDVVSERLVWHYNIHDQLEARTGLTRSQVENAVQRLSQWGVYRIFCNIQAHVLTLFMHWE